MTKSVFLMSTLLCMTAGQASRALAAGGDGPAAQPLEARAKPVSARPVGAAPVGGTPQETESKQGPTSSPLSTSDQSPVSASAPAPGAGTRSQLRSVSAKDESIYVLQRRSYSKKGKLEITPLAITGINPKFVGYLGGGVSAAYHAYENLAIEVTSSLPFLFYAFYSDLVYEVYHYESLTPEVVDLKQMSYFGAASLQLSALYGKFEFYNWLMDFDFYTSAGVGVARTLETCNAATDGEACSKVVEDIGRGLRVPEANIDHTKITGNLAIGVRLFFNEMLGIRAEVRDIVYSDRARNVHGENKTDIRNNLLLMVGASLML